MLRSTQWLRPHTHLFPFPTMAAAMMMSSASSAFTSSFDFSSKRNNNTTNDDSSSNAPDVASGESVDRDEASRFRRSSHQWWDPRGPYRFLHLMNLLRARYIQDCLLEHFDRPAASASTPAPLHGLRLLDVGCGGGLLSEGLAKLGAQVTGIDMLKDNIHTAQRHLPAHLAPRVTYLHTTAEDLSLELGRPSSTLTRFDAVCALEVIEHVASPPTFIKTCSELVHDNGAFFVSTLNQTPLSYALAIFGAEYILGEVPMGTHTYDKFVKPEVLRDFLHQNWFEVKRSSGLCFHPLEQKWTLTANHDVNYIFYAVCSRPAQVLSDKK
eukprot:gnl/Spiro4/16601_TR8938_c0_g1_i1.p1 gnl/Spiro4/16601_TR8938_c0_g1~~gnl/Spiro4/16601_TR8938_c0_g1_i1.p1  ORF type:complete len:325 (-),score=40.73 gnl/Spiro4/16601_TR8938_c0_g1_i1:42-1016(-)